MTDEDIKKELSTADTFVDFCSEIRQDTLILADKVKILKSHHIFKELPEISDQSEMMANIMLTYRHLEDARMRIGKVVQAFDGGKSAYPR